MTAGKTTRSVLLGPDLVLERARPLDVHARRAASTFSRDDPPRLLDEADLVAVADAELDVGAEQAVLALDHRRPLDHPDVGHRGQRDLHRRGLAAPAAAAAVAAHRRRPCRRPGRPSAAIPRAETRMPLERLDVVAVVAGVADADRVALAALDGHRQRPAPHRHLDDVLDVADVDAVAGRLLAVDLDLDVALADDLVGEDVGRAADRRGAPPAISWLTRWISSRFAPKTFTPTGSRTPVESISIRLAIGWVKLLPQPGICKAVLISSTRSSFVFFQSRSRSANGFSSAAAERLRARPAVALARGQLPVAAQLRSAPRGPPRSAAPTARSNSSQLSAFDPLLEPVRRGRRRGGRRSG